MTEYIFIKISNKDMLVKELKAANIYNLIKDISIDGNILKITVTRDAEVREEQIIYNVVKQHTSPTNAEKAVQQRVTAAMQFGQQFMIEFATENIMIGLTTEQIFKVLLKYGHIQSMILSGSLYTALDAIQAIPPDDLISQERKDRLIKKIKAFLGT